MVVRIHPGQSARARTRTLGAGLVLCAAVLTNPVAAQSAAVPSADTLEVAADPADVVAVARAAQARFELRRTRHLPLSWSGPGWECDEHVGRFCSWYGEGEWHPVPEAPEIVEMRGELIAVLDSLQPLAPSSDWILGQRVWYRGEAGQWASAAAVARSCGGAEPWWCAALEGLALHAAEAYPAAEAAFGRALELMDAERREAWQWPRWPVDGDARAVLDAAAESGDGARLLGRLWALADPLWLVPGNDRRSAHYARWTVTRLRERARNPFRISWGDDLSQLVVRHGWELGWERSPDRSFSTVDNVIGHKHPEGRDYMPPGSVLLDPATATAEELRADVRRPRSLYAPAYAPVLLPMEGQIAVFPRVGEAVVVSTQFLPEDTTFHAAHDHARPWMDAGARADEPDRIGLYLLPVEPRGAERGDEAADPRPIGVSRAGRTAGSLLLSVPPGDYVVSAEAWSPSTRRAGRLRKGLRIPPVVEDIPVLSDLLLIEPGPDPGSLEAAVDRALPSLRVDAGQGFDVAWEVGGLGFRAETLAFELSIERSDRGALRRIGEFLRLADRPRPLRLSWEEPAAREPGSSFHAIDLELPPLDPGRYRVRLTLRTVDRSDVVRDLGFEVSGDGSL